MDISWIGTTGRMPSAYEISDKITLDIALNSLHKLKPIIRIL